MRTHLDATRVLLNPGEVKGSVHTTQKQYVKHLDFSSTMQSFIIMYFCVFRKKIYIHVVNGSYTGEKITDGPSNSYMYAKCMTYVRHLERNYGTEYKNTSKRYMFTTNRQFFRITVVMFTCMW